MSDQDLTESVSLLRTAWEAAVAYRRHVAEHTGQARAHLEDMDLFGVLVEQAHDGALVGTPEAVMARVIAEQRTVPWLPEEFAAGAPQVIYETCMDLLIDMGVTKWIDEDENVIVTKRTEEDER